MDMIPDDDDIPQKKPSVLTEECYEMLVEAENYIAEDSPKQARIMRKRFFAIARILETFPEIGSPYKNGLRKFKLGKFRYNIYYRIETDIISIVGIWHTSRGTEFKEP
ncbi:MAG: type II toxin-antitoxin system RelE/ParE family toxin [Fibromonadaceae bacterium]|nr:type II toxin-antitoxin system RelE/ParE family toxin [Fibromonadaceae bacterium]